MVEKTSRRRSDTFLLVALETLSSASRSSLLTRTDNTWYRGLLSFALLAMIHLSAMPLSVLSLQEVFVRVDAAGYCTASSGRHTCFTEGSPPAPGLLRPFAPHTLQTGLTNLQQSLPQETDTTNPRNKSSKNTGIAKDPDSAREAGGAVTMAGAARLVNSPYSPHCPVTGCLCCLSSPELTVGTALTRTQFGRPP